jgi:hypothetical protein
LLTTLEGSWEVHFPPDRGAPEKVILENLSSWSDSLDRGVKYFSGTATYTKAFELSPGQLIEEARSRIWLDLGSVKNLAEVFVNGKSLGIVWKTPFRVEMKDVLQPGQNLLEVKVTNLWVNRLIGDAQPEVVKPFTYTTRPFYRAASPLQPSGLLGPVRILRSPAVSPEDSARK